MALGCAGPEKVFDTVLIYMVMTTVIWMGVTEAESKMVETIHEKSQGRVVDGNSMSDEFQFNSTGSAVNPLLLMMVMESNSIKINRRMFSGRRCKQTIWP